MNQPIKCCQNCTERHQNCHAECDRYKQQKEDYIALKQQILHEKKKRQMTEAYFAVNQAKQRRIKKFGKKGE